MVQSANFRSSSAQKQNGGSNPFEQQNFLWVRHAKSTANAAEHTERDSWSNPEHIDAELSPQGIEECKNSEVHQVLATLEMSCVIVSPLRRAILTAYHLLSDHPNFNSI